MSTSVNSLTSNFFPEAENGFTTTTAGSVSSGATTVTLNSVSGYTNGAVAVFVIDPTDATKKQTFTGVIDTAGVQVTNVVWTAGTNQTHALGATVVDYATATHISMVTKGLLAAGLNQGGTMTPKVLTSINDTNGNEVIVTPATASAVNEITVTNAATGNAPSISATGGDSAVNLNLRGKGLAKTVTIGAGATNIYLANYVSSGCIWTADAAGSTRLASMTAGVVVVGGNPITVAAVTSRTFTASRDTYVDVLDNGDSTGLVVYTEVTNNAASPALAANSIRIATVVTAAGSIAASTAIGQGGYANISPVISSQVFKGFDSLGNKIYPKGPSTPAIAQNPYMFNVHLAANQTGIADVTATKVAWDTKKFDTGANFDTTTNRRFTAPVAGFYQINAQIDLLSPGNTMVASIFYLYKNGSNTHLFHDVYPNVGVGNQVNTSGSLSELIQLAAGDYLEIFVYADVTSSTLTVIGGATGSSFSGFLVSAS